MGLKLRVIPRIPASFTATGGLSVVKKNGVWTLSPDWSDLALVTTLNSPETKEIWARDPTTDTYVRISIQAFVEQLNGRANAFFSPVRRTVTSGVVTVSATTDDVVIVNLNTPAAINVTFPTVAARIAAGGHWVGVKNEHANPALYPLQPVRSGSDTIAGTAAPLPQDHGTITWYAPVEATNDWEIQN